MALRPIAILAVGFIMALAAEAQAATVTTTEWWDKYGPHTNVAVIAGAGERNDMTVEYADGTTLVTDSAPLQAGSGCTLQADGNVLCLAAPWYLEIDAGDLDDHVEIRQGGVLTRLFGSDGNDNLAAAGTRVTEFNGGAGDDHMVGGPGEDRFLEGPAANGSDTMLGDGADLVSYRERVNNVHADLQGDADDGEAGEQDRVGTGIRTLLGGAGHDRLEGGPGEDLLAGFEGSDALLGGGGDDRLQGGRMRSPETTNDRLYGGRGADELHGGGGGDLLIGGRGPDHLFGHHGRDVLYGGPGRETMSGGPGNDRLRALDGLADQLDCGGGWDRVRHDVFDSLTADCERHGPTRA